MKTAPVALFVYNRPDHAKKALEALNNCDGAQDTLLIIFSDGPKSDADKILTNKVQTLVSDFDFKGKKEIIRQEKNKGLSASISDGLDECLDKFGKVIVMEDDLVCHPAFLKYSNAALERYKHEEKVMQTCGFMFPHRNKWPEYFLSPSVFCWGWSTWSRAWKQMNRNAQQLHDIITERKLEEKFDMNGAYPYFHLLKHTLAGKSDSWAIRWYASVFLNKGLSLYPSSSYIINEGMEGSGAHYNSAAMYPRMKLRGKGNNEYKFPETIDLNPEIQRGLEKSLKRFYNPSITDRFGMKLTRIFGS
ncbi:MAG: glycosyltransferase [Bacteroidetes bacterium]|nr:MAG: glycosyltransferase [Bacteroidota bacterium]REJ99710.1 MAG: glycosyltransferase [Bacteroidota bacterium]REK32904.1 MAG: glycosyltransferase [Bacteroidota bacterium]REK47709.1 MAG: glycosyltransferase [Bacteroidota bacterium]